MSNRSIRVSRYGCGRWDASQYTVLAREVGAAGCMDPDGTIRPAAFIAAARTRDTYFAAMAAHHGGKMDAIYAAITIGMHSQVLLHALFVSAGRQVFQFGTGIVADFKRTDVSETPVGKLTLPYAAGFLHFGIQDDLMLNDVGRTSAEYVDGAYYYRAPPGALTIQLTLSRPNHETWSKIPGPFCTLEESDLDIPAHEAIDRVLNRFVNEAKPDDNLSGRETMSAISDGFWEWADTTRPILHASLALVLNALFYLEAYGSDTQPMPPADAPADLSEEYAQAMAIGKLKRVREAKKALLADGYSLVRLCGTTIGTSDGPPAETRDSRTVRTHWRRGHWRMQPYGPQLSNYKRIWVRPVLVGKESGTPLLGHEYAVATDKPTG
jgi:hypothetical protein